MADDLDDLLNELGVDADVTDESISKPRVYMHESTRADLNELGVILLECCPPDEKNTVSLGILARKCGVTPPAIYNIIKRERITYSRAKQILGFQDLFTEEPIYGIDDLEPYII